MKQVFVICVSLLYLLGCISSEAKAFITTKTESRKERSNISPFPLHQDHPANITQPFPFQCIAFKALDQKALPGLIGQDDLTNGGLHEQLGKHLNVNQFPACVSSVRLLLFPNHYFW